jgi:hypothetical protein
VALISTFLAGLVTALALAAWAYYRTGLGAQNPHRFDASARRFDLREHLNGPIQCEGVIYGPTGRVTSRFVGDFDARWEGNVGTMREEFLYDSGARQSREWRLTVGNDGRIGAEADDVVGRGTGIQAGPAVRLDYRIRLPDDAGGHVLDATDWMYLMENGAIINHSQFRKYGIRVAELVATMRRREP